MLFYLYSSSTIRYRHLDVVVSIAARNATVVLALPDTLFRVQAIRLKPTAKSAILAGTLPLLLEVASSLAYYSLLWKYCELARWLSHRIFFFTLLTDLDDHLRGSVHLIVSERQNPNAFLF